MAAHGELAARHFAGRNLEAVLTRLRQIIGLVEPEHDYDGLDAATARTFEIMATRTIVEAIESARVDADTYRGFALWAARQERSSPVEIFSLNYDLVLEAALESFAVPYFDGFVGQLRAPFRGDLVEAAPSSSHDAVPASFVRLWKLHGSINWAVTDDAGTRRILRLGVPAGSDEVAAIYPSEAKYTESRRVPFLVLHDRLRRSLAEPETLLIVAGYSFGDEHVNEILFDSASRHPRSTFVAFCHDKIAPSLADNALRIPNLIVTSPEGLISGGAYEDWRLSEDVPDVFESGEFVLGDFAHLSKFLGRSMEPVDAST